MQLKDSTRMKKHSVLKLGLHQFQIDAIEVLLALNMQSFPHVDS